MLRLVDTRKTQSSMAPSMAATVATTPAFANKPPAPLLEAPVGDADAACEDEEAALLAGVEVAEEAGVEEPAAGVEAAEVGPPMGAVDAPSICACTEALKVPVIPCRL